MNWSKKIILIYILPSKDALANQYLKFSDHKLLDILYYKEEYRQEAVEAVTEELKKRNITPEKNYKLHSG